MEIAIACAQKIIKKEVELSPEILKNVVMEAAAPEIIKETENDDVDDVFDEEDSHAHGYGTNMGDGGGGGGVWYGGGTYSSFELQGGVISCNSAGNRNPECEFTFWSAKSRRNSFENN